ncbi:hypothetical protein H9P43_007740 [Blastocladiella emersonii ATCC 22665]|nr:hypothetical protein H9P43_007740 [Blastocladiella emersonii ATCC 22665]
MTAAGRRPSSVPSWVRPSRHDHRHGATVAASAVFLALILLLAAGTTEAVLEPGFKSGVPGRTCQGYSLASSKWCSGFSSAFLGPTNIAPGVLFLLNKPENSQSDLAPLLADGLGNLTSAEQFDAAYEKYIVRNAQQVAERWGACPFANNGVPGMVTYACQWIINYGFLVPSGKVWFQESCTRTNVSAVATTGNGAQLPRPPGLCKSVSITFADAIKAQFDVDPSCNPASKPEMASRVADYLARSTAVTNRNDTSRDCISATMNEAKLNLCGYMTPIQACLNDCKTVPNCPEVLKGFTPVRFSSEFPPTGDKDKDKDNDKAGEGKSADGQAKEAGEPAAEPTVFSPGVAAGLSVGIVFLVSVGLAAVVLVRRRRGETIGPAGKPESGGGFGFGKSGSAAPSATDNMFRSYMPNMNEPGITERRPSVTPMLPPPQISAPFKMPTSPMGTLTRSRAAASGSPAPSSASNNQYRNNGAANPSYGATANAPQSPRSRAEPLLTRGPGPDSNSPMPSPIPPAPISLAPAFQTSTPDIPAGSFVLANGQQFVVNEHGVGSLFSGDAPSSALKLGPPPVVPTERRSSYMYDPVDVSNRPSLLPPINMASLASEMSLSGLAAIDAIQRGSLARTPSPPAAASSGSSAAGVMGTSPAGSEQHNQQYAALSKAKVVLFPYKPTRDDEIELTAGDMVAIEVEFDDGWGIGTLYDMNGRPVKHGAFPLNCFEMPTV